MVSVDDINIGDMCVCTGKTDHSDSSAEAVTSEYTNRNDAIEVLVGPDTDA